MYGLKTAFNTSGEGSPSPVKSRNHEQRFRIAAHIWVIGLVAGMTAVAQQPAPYRLTLQDAIQKSASSQPERAGCRHKS